MYVIEIWPCCSEKELHYEFWAAKIKADKSRVQRTDNRALNRREEVHYYYPHVDPILGVVITVDVVVGVLVHRAEEEEDEQVDKKTEVWSQCSEKNYTMNSELQKSKLTSQEYNVPIIGL